MHNDHVRCNGGKYAALDTLPSEADPAQATSNPTTTQDQTQPPALPTTASLPQFFDPITAAEFLGRPDANNPTGRGPDEFRARTWDAFQTTRPMQSAEDRNVNTPVLPSEHIKTRNIGAENPQFDRSRTDHLEQSGPDDDDEE